MKPTIKYDDETCFFCERRIRLGSEADLEAHRVGEWACRAAGHIDDFDDLGPFITDNGDALPQVTVSTVCFACAERLAGPDWREKGRAAIAENDAWRDALRATGSRDPDWEELSH